MSNMRMPSSIFFALALLGAVQYGYYAPRLPEILGSHFAVNGAVNGWQSKGAFFSIELAVVALAAVVGFGIPRMIGAMPVSLINLPNKEFWLSPERREDTFGYLQMHMAWFGCALLAFLLFVMELVFRANMQRPVRMNSAALVTALVAFLVFSGASTVRLVVRFARIRS
jgi:heme A synthase